MIYCRWLLMVCYVCCCSGCFFWHERDEPREHRRNNRNQSLSSAIDSGTAHSNSSSRSSSYTASVNTSSTSSAISSQTNNTGDDNELDSAWLAYQHFISMDVNGDVEDIRRGGIQFQTNINQFTALRLGLNLTDVDYERHWEYYRSINNPFILDCNILVLLHPNPSKVMIRPYCGVGLGFGAMWWQFEEDIINPDGPDIGSDSVGILRLEALAGVSYRPIPQLIIGIEGRAEHTSHSQTTAEGFDNDIINSYGTYGVAAFAGMHF